MPSTAALLDLQATGVAAGLQLPLGELPLALGPQLDVISQPETLVAHPGTTLRAYLLAHLGQANPLATLIGQAVPLSQSKCQLIVCVKAFSFYIHFGFSACLFETITNPFECRYQLPARV